jgi:hypothetical protein
MHEAGRIASVLASAGLLATLLVGPTAAAEASSSVPTPLLFQFVDCTGPAGTPNAFDAVKEPSNAAALHLVGRPGIFVAVKATDVETGTILFSTPGFTHNQLPTVSCLLFHPVTQRWLSIVGMIAPVV